MNKIYYSLIKIDEFNPLDLPNNILSHSSKYHLEKKNRISRCAYYYLGELMNKVYGLNLLDKIYFSNNGKPLIDGYYISLSHRDDYLLVSISSINEGVDIEEMKDNYNPKIISRFMDKEVTSKNEFYRLWTIKEVITKIEDISLFSKVDIDKYHIVSFVKDNNMISIGAKEEFELVEIEL